MLKEQIVGIVETESEGFLDVASKLDGFRQILTDLKDSHSDFHANFSAEKAKTDQVYGYLLEQYVSLQAMLHERKELKELVKLQQIYNEVQKRISVLGQPTSGGGDEYLELETTVRMWHELESLAMEGQIGASGHWPERSATRGNREFIN